MPLVSSLISPLLTHPNLAASVTVDSLLLFFRLITHLKERLSWHCTSSQTGPPPSLPSDVHQFLVTALRVNDPSVISDLWALFRDIAWSLSPPKDSDPDGSQRAGDLLGVFMRCGLAFDIGFRDLYPPTRVCLNPQCMSVGAGQVKSPRDLTRVKFIRVVHFIREYGPIPSLSFSGTCRECGTRYYPTYYVHGSESDQMRTYYPGVPSTIHVTKHVFVETSLCMRFTNSMVCAWVSATNNGRIYDLEHIDARTRFPAVWSVSPSLTVTIVWDAFFILSLVRDYKECGSQLHLSNVGDQSDRLDGALHARNKLMAGQGQEHWSHACDWCCSVQLKDDKHQVMRAVIMDGVTVGRPCCNVHDCQGRLPTQRARFCLEHTSLDKVCVVEGCATLADQGHRTCPEESHRQLESTAGQSALFQLRRCLERQKMLRVEDTDELLEVDSEELSCPEKAAAGNVKLRARFGRRRTHNEQLCVATCGVMLGRATFFGSEVINGAREFLHGLFPTKKSLPQIIFYDNACNLQKHIIAEGDLHFSDCALPVNVFHMKTKHKDSDEFCGRYCNPALFPDLIVNGRWRFNSSAAEMTNSWFVGYQAIVREMRANRFDFFLDEMIKLRNRMIVDDLRSAGAHPFHLPRDYLLS
ncbi:hypothetical protein OF83DRAFT_1072073 [Amylostereum chailletii]|nr:hypothetical protein OF83DRAFT_1072073 [Amylostereum chailletii]